MKTEILGKGARGSNSFFFKNQNLGKHLFIQRFWILQHSTLEVTQR